MKTEAVFELASFFSLLLAIFIGLVSPMTNPSVPVFLSSLTLIVLIVFVRIIGKRMKCRDVWILLHDSVMAQRSNLIWYVLNEAHGFAPPDYQLMVLESFFDKSKTLHTELAKLKQIAEEEMNERFVTEIQKQLEEWESILNQMQQRINNMDFTRKL
ncbi:MAG: hypothetical protein JW779_07265 [Candidatus Thorarchaeota archaeon]|nr:hypothetical protein [Candidatus Thorarchaeota archaeon]